MQERVPAPSLHRLEPEKAQFNGLDQKLYEKDDRVHQGTKTSYVTVKTTSKTKKLLENKEEQLNQLKETLEV